VREKWDLVDLELPEMPGLCLVVEETLGGKRLPCISAQPHGAVVYATAWRDRAGGVHEWLELWVQDATSWHLDGELPLLSLTNSALDRHWTHFLDSLERVSPGSVFRMGWESAHPEALYLTEDARARAKPSQPWVLCTDDATLRSERLAAFSDSLHRYLWNGAADAPQFIPLTQGAPEGRSTRAPADVFGKAIPINPGGGLMLLRKAMALRYDDFVDLLSGAEGKTSVRECLRIPAVGANARLLDRPGFGSKSSGYFFSRNQVPGHLGELLHLKLALFRGVIAAVGTAVERSGTPFLGIRPDHFGVSLVCPEESLPYLWNHRVGLGSAPQAVRTELGDTREPCFVPFGDPGRSIYKALRAEGEVRGQGRVRIRRVSEPDDDGLVVVEGSLITDETLQAGRLDLLGLEWTTRKSGRLRLFAKIDGAAADVAAEYRFTSLQTRLPPELNEWLAEGESTLSSDRVAFQLLPRLGTPCDLYSLGVLALRTLIAGSGVPLSEALDDLLAMSRLYRSRFSNGNWNTGSASLHEFVKSGEGGAWAEKLGPHRLIRDRVSAEEAFREIPAPMWWEVIEFVARLFPGEALGSFCKGYDDFSPRAPHEVFTEPLVCLDSLVVRSRDLLFGNPQTNRELLGLIRTVAAKG
jgi:hypothetical protein